MIDIENMKCIVEQEIKKCHFESLHYVLFDEDSSYIIGNTIKFDNFEDAKTSFISKLEHFVESTKKGIKVGFSPYYSSPLWDDAE